MFAIEIGNNKEISRKQHMSAESYKRLLRSTYNHLSSMDIPAAVEKLIEEIMNMPHSDKEEAFVKLSIGISPFPRLHTALNSNNKKEMEIHI